MFPIRRLLIMFPISLFNPVNFMNVLPFLMLLYSFFSLVLWNVSLFFFVGNVSRCRFFFSLHQFGHSSVINVFNLSMLTITSSPVNSSFFHTTPLSSPFRSSTLSKMESGSSSFDSDQMQIPESPYSEEDIDFKDDDCAIKIDLICKYYGLKQAEEYIETIPEFIGREFLYRTLLCNCVRQNNMKKAERVVSKMEGLKLPITVFTCNELLLLYKMNDCRTKFVNVLRFMENHNIKRSSDTYSIVIDMLGQSQDFYGIHRILDGMKAEDMEPDLPTQANLAMHYMLAGLHIQGEAILKRLGADNMTKNRWLCRILLRLYANLGDVNEVRKIWNLCKRNPHYEECLAAMEAWGKLKKPEQAERVFDMVCCVKEWDFFPESWELMLQIYNNNNMLMRRKDLLLRMGDSGCRLDPVTLDAIVKLHVEAGDVEKADILLHRAKRRARPMSTSYCIILKQYANRGDIRNTEKILRAMEEDKYPVGRKVYQNLKLAHKKRYSIKNNQL